MSRRFLVILIVFVVGFGVGWGATWLIVGPADTTPQPVATPTAPATKPAADPTRAASTETAPPVTAPPATSPPVTAEADAATGPADDDAAVVAADAAPAAPPEDDAPGADDPAVPVEDPPSDPTEDRAAWWNACHQKVCLVDWGRVSGGISVRAGELEHGEEVDWAKTFAKADKVATLEARKNMKVEVLAIGMSEGKPAAAWIKYRKTKGVIALNFGDKSIRFEPTAD